MIRLVFKLLSHHNWLNTELFHFSFFLSFSIVIATYINNLLQIKIVYMLQHLSFKFIIIRHFLNYKGGIREHYYLSLFLILIFELSRILKLEIILY